MTEVADQPVQVRGTPRDKASEPVFSDVPIAGERYGWRYSDTGRCEWVHDEDDFPQGSPCGKRNLVEVACELWAGFIWFDLDPDAQPLREWLDPVADHLDVYRMEDMKRTHWVTVGVTSTGSVSRTTSTRATTCPTCTRRRRR